MTGKSSRTQKLLKTEKLYKKLGQIYKHAMYKEGSTNLSKHI